MQPDGKELKIVMQQIAEKNASILAPHDKEFNNTWSLELFPNENTCTLCRIPLGALQHGLNDAPTPNALPDTATTVGKKVWNIQVNI